MEFKTPFYPNMLTPAEQKEIQLSKLWPVVLSLHHNYGIYASHIERFKRPNGQLYPRVLMVSKEGMPVVSVRDSMSKSKRGRYDSSKPPTILVSMADYLNYENEELVQSANARYVISKVSNDKTVSERILDGAMRAERAMPNRLCGLINGYSEALIGRLDTYDWRLSDLSQMSLVHLWEGSRKREDLAPSVREECEKVIQARDAKAAHMQGVIDDATAMFNKPKWFICWMEQGWVVGGYHMAPMVDCVKEICADPDKHIGFRNNIGTEILPFRLYKSLDNMPPEDATTLKATLATNKMYLQTNLPNIKALSDEGFFASGYGTQVCEDIGLVMHNQRFMLIDKW